MILNGEVPTEYTGKMDGAIIFTAPKPFVILGWGETDAKFFDTEHEARQFLNKAKCLDKYAAFARMYGFAEARWVRL